MKVRSSCHTGTLDNSSLRIINPTEVCSPDSSYLSLAKPIPADKLAHVTQMCNRFIPPERWPRSISTYLQQPPIPPPTPAPGTVLAPCSQSVLDANQLPTQQPSAPPPPPKRRKPLQCPTRGCDGTGHRNKKRWSEGHRTKAGCPRVPR